MRADFLSVPVTKEFAPNFNRNVFCVLGLTVDAVTFSQTKDCVVTAINERKRLFLTTPNTNFVTISRSDPKFRDSILCSDLCVADGMPLVWIARMLGVPIYEKVAGSSLFAALVGDAAVRMNVFFFGGNEGRAKTAFERLNGLGTGVHCVGYHFPGFGSVNEMSDPGVLQKINGSKADFLVVALSARKGQPWILDNQRSLTTPVVCQLGSTINYIIDAVKRAPEALQRLGLEWLWRIMQEPYLWWRYFVDLMVLLELFVLRVIPCIAYQMVNSPTEAELCVAKLHVDKSGNSYTLSFTGSWDKRNLAPVRDILQRAADEKADIVLDFAELRYADAAFLGLILMAYGHQTRTGDCLSIRSLGDRMKTILYLHSCEFLAKNFGEKLSLSSKLMYSGKGT
jgi:N-acetylglucosaminyldiphosphoundecaprenol N-acetyl-beta-D-mannosaminyltransferase